MIELINNLPATVVGVVVTGTVTAKDYEDVLIPALQSALKKNNRVRMLYQIGPKFSGFELGAMWDDLKIGLSHFNQWERIAVVTDVSWIANAVRIFGVTIPCPVKVFGVSELSQAEQWVALT